MQFEVSFQSTSLFYDPNGRPPFSVSTFPRRMQGNATQNMQDSLVCGTHFSKCCPRRKPVVTAVPMIMKSPNLAERTQQSQIVLNNQQFVKGSLRKLLLFTFPNTVVSAEMASSLNVDSLEYIAWTLKALRDLSGLKYRNEYLHLESKHPNVDLERLQTNAYATLVLSVKCQDKLATSRTQADIQAVIDLFVKEKQKIDSTLDLYEDAEALTRAYQEGKFPVHTMVNEPDQKDPRDKDGPNDQPKSLQPRVFLSYNDLVKMFPDLEDD